MKRTLFGLMVFGVVLAVFALRSALEPTTSIDWRSFEPRFRDTIRDAGFIILEEQMCGSDEVALPINLRLRPAPGPSQGKISFTVGFPDSGLHYIVKRDDPARIDCYARYLAGRAVVIEIRSRRPQQSAAIDLRNAMLKEFPGIPMRLKSQ